MIGYRFYVGVILTTAQRQSSNPTSSKRIKRLRARQTSIQAPVNSRFLLRLPLAVFMLLPATLISLSAQASVIDIELSQPCPDEIPFTATVVWNLDEESVDRAEVRVDSADGTVFTGARESGQSTTGRWVRPGMRFFLVDAEDGRVLGEAEVSMDGCDRNAVSPVEGVPARAERSRSDSGREPELLMPPPSATPSARPPAILEPRGRFELGDEEFLRLSPPRLRYCGQPVETAMVRVMWDVTGLDEEHARIYLDMPGGQVLVDGPARGEEITGEWVTDGMRFVLYLPDLEEVVAVRQFRILPCSVVDYPDEPVED
jgi:hypothetical protein